MKKLLLTVIMAGALSACETANSLRGVGANGAMTAVSCGQIYNTFEAYKRDKQNMLLLAQLAGITNLDVSKATPENAAEYYQSAVLSANIALALQGCQQIAP